MIALRDIRKSRHMTMKELGKKVGVTEAAIGYYETGKRLINYEMLLKLSEALDCSVADILGYEKNPTTENDDGSSDLFTEIYNKFNQLPDDDREYIVSLINRLLNKED